MTAVRTSLTLVCLAVAPLVSGGAAHADDPVLKPGRDPGGTAIAILADGFDYTNPELAKVLARDGEGEAIAWDAVDQDHRPYEKEGKGTAAAIAAAAKSNVRIVQVRVNPNDTTSLARGIAFAVQTPATIILALLPASDASGRGVLVAAAQKFETTLFIGSPPALTPGDEVPTNGLENLLLIEAGMDGLAAVEALATVLGCGEHVIERKSTAELKRAILDGRKETLASACKPKGAGETQKP